MASGYSNNATGRNDMKFMGPQRSAPVSHSLFGDHLSVLAKLKAATKLHDVAAILGYQPKSLAFLIYKMPPTARYTQFPVPKKGGGVESSTPPKKS